MNPANLHEYLDTYHSLETSAVISPQNARVLMSLKELAKSRNQSKDISAEIQRLVKSLISHKSWNAQTAFEKLINVLAGRVDKRLFLMKRQKQLDSKDWLKKFLESIATRLGGSISVSYTSMRSLYITIHGSVSMKYSVFMTMKGADLIHHQSCLSQVHTTRDVVLMISEASIPRFRLMMEKIDFISNRLQKMGFHLDMGQKTCEQVLRQIGDYQDRNNLALQNSFSMTLDFADALAKTPTQFITLPLTLNISTPNDDLMHLLESFYRHPLVDLRNEDGTPKIFNPETRQSGVLHQSVLDIHQLDNLICFLDRLAYFSDQLGIPVNQIQEEDMYNGIKVVYSNINSNLIQLTQQDGYFDLSHLELQAFTSFREKLARTSKDLGVYNHDIAEYCQKNLIPGPYVFLKNTPFIEEYHAIRADIFHQQSIEKWPNFRESYREIKNCQTPRSPLPLKEYAAAIATSCLISSQAFIGNNLAEHAAGVAWLNQTVDREINGAAAHQHYLDFYTENNASYLLYSLVDSISECLNHPNCSEAHIEKLLHCLGVSAENFLHLMPEIDGHRHFNRFQVKLFLLPMTLHALCQKELLADVECLSKKRNPWVEIVLQNNQKTYVDTPEKWQKFAMTKWKNKQIKGISWNTRQDESTAQKRASNTDTHGFFAESSKVAKTINETQEQTSQVLSIPS